MVEAARIVRPEGSTYAVTTALITRATKLPVERDPARYGLYAMQSISTSSPSPGSAAAATVVRAGW